MSIKINEVPNNQVLISNIASRKFSKYISDDVLLEEVFYDIATNINSYMNSLNLDKRALSISADYHQIVWQIISTTDPVMKQTVFNNMQLVNQMIISILKPQHSLILVPDQYLITVAALDAMGSSLTFVNDQSLFNFENFVLSNTEYPFSRDYFSIDYQDLIDESFNEKYDFIFTGSIALYADTDLLNIMVNSLNQGGCMIVADSSLMAEMYKSIAYVNYGDPYHDLLCELENVYRYHIPFGIGFDVIVKM